MDSDPTFRLPRRRKPLPILGAGQQAKELGQLLVAQRNARYKVVGFLDRDSTRVGERLVNPSIIGTLEQLFEIVVPRRRELGGYDEPALAQQSFHLRKLRLGLRLRLRPARRLARQRDHLAPQIAAFEERVREHETRGIVIGCLADPREELVEVRGHRREPSSIHGGRSDAFGG